MQSFDGDSSSEVCGAWFVGVKMSAFPICGCIVADEKAAGRVGGCNRLILRGILPEETWNRVGASL
jgi:hypothetical protein